MLDGRLIGVVGRCGGDFRGWEVESGAGKLELVGAWTSWIQPTFRETDGWIGR